LLEPVFHRLLAGSGLRQLKREARCAHSKVMALAAPATASNPLFQVNLMDLLLRHHSATTLRSTSCRFSQPAMPP
jgi:hypothetical protein